VDIGCGIVFRVTPSDVLTTIHTFAPVLDGSLPEPRDLIFDVANNILIGTMRTPTGCDEPDPFKLCRALFHLTLTGTLTTPYVFSDQMLNEPGYRLVLSSDGNLYGLNDSTVFQLTPDGERTTLYDLTANPYGYGTIIQSASGDLVGTSIGGPNCGEPQWVCGGVFRIGLFDVADAPNLGIRSFKAPNRAAVGATLTLTSTTINRGTAAAAPSDTTFWFSNTGSLAGAQRLGGEALPSIAPGASITRSEIVTLPPVGPGVYSLIARADGAGVVHEAYEADNTIRRPLIVGPDLAIRQIFPPAPGLSIDPLAPTSTAPTAVSVHTANTGGDVVGASTTYLYASATRRPSANAVLLATLANGPMNPQEHNQIVLSLTLPQGTYWLVARADAIGAIEEANENNNEGALYVTVQ
jgi:hypothetical protein